MATKLLRLEILDPPSTTLYCPFTGKLVISAENPKEIETRLSDLSPYLRFVLFYQRTSYPVFWAANPETLDEEDRQYQEAVVRLWTIAADVGQGTVTMDGDWYIEYLRKLEDVLPESSLLLEIKSFYAIDAKDLESALNNPNLHISWDFSAAYVIAACFVSKRPPEKLSFRRVKTMWDDFIPDFTSGKA